MLPDSCYSYSFSLLSFTLLSSLLWLIGLFIINFSLTWTYGHFSFLFTPLAFRGLSHYDPLSLLFISTISIVSSSSSSSPTNKFYLDCISSLAASFLFFLWCDWLFSFLSSRPLLIPFSSLFSPYALVFHLSNIHGPKSSTSSALITFPFWVWNAFDSVLHTIYDSIFLSLICASSAIFFGHTPHSKYTRCIPSCSILQTLHWSLNFASKGLIMFTSTHVFAKWPRDAIPVFWSLLIGRLIFSPTFYIEIFNCEARNSYQ